MKIYQKKILQKLIIENIDDFLKELESGFSYIGSEYKIRIGCNYNYIDNNLKKINPDKTTGIIICKKDNKFIIDYC